MQSPTRPTLLLLLLLLLPDANANSSSTTNTNTTAIDSSDGTVGQNWKNCATIEVGKLDYVLVLPVRLCNIFITFFIHKDPNVSAPHMILKAKGTVF